MVVQFTQRLLAKELLVFSELEISPAVSGAFIFVCRQMYNTCEGLQVLRPYGLHECIAKAWRKVTFIHAGVIIYRVADVTYSGVITWTAPLLL